MITVWKTVLRATDVQDIEIPAGAELLFAREQHDKICVWCRCNTDSAIERRRIAVVGTGHPAPPAESGRYLGSASLHGGNLIFHVFEYIENKDRSDA